jgi:hypothetical protein
MNRGGIRSIVQLSILAELERLVDLDIPIQNFFDLIIGTRSGFPFRNSGCKDVRTLTSQ